MRSARRHDRIRPCPELVGFPRWACRAAHELRLVPAIFVSGADCRRRPCGRRRCGRIDDAGHGQAHIAGNGDARTARSAARAVARNSAIRAKCPKPARPGSPNESVAPVAARKVSPPKPPTCPTRACPAAPATAPVPPAAPSKNRIPCTLIKESLQPEQTQRKGGAETGPAAKGGIIDFRFRVPFANGLFHGLPRRKSIANETHDWERNPNRNKRKIPPESPSAAPAPTL